MIEQLERMLAAGTDNALLRFSLGNAYRQTDCVTAVMHLRRAVELDPGYSAAWKLLGQALTDCGDRSSAAATYRRGIEVAETRGDIQAVKEMRVFLKRLDKLRDSPVQD